MHTRTHMHIYVYNNNLKEAIGLPDEGGNMGEVESSVLGSHSASSANIL